MRENESAVAFSFATMHDTEHNRFYHVLTLGSGSLKFEVQLPPEACISIGEIMVAEGKKAKLGLITTNQMPPKLKGIN